MMEGMNVSEVTKAEDSVMDKIYQMLVEARQQQQQQKGSVYPATHKGCRTTSQYVPMRDGVNLAVDINLPDMALNKNCQESTFPVLLVLTRYWRSFEMRFPSRPGRVPIGPRNATVCDYFVQRGYAVVLVDVRGTGASEGVWSAPWSPLEIRDNEDLSAWIRSSSWCNGLIGSFGLSYEGNSAAYLVWPPLCMENQDCAVSAAIAQEIETDIYSDITLPGGIFNDVFIRAWTNMNTQIDSNRLHPIIPSISKIFIKGIRLVDSDRVAPRGSKLADILKHRDSNVNAYNAISNVVFRDDPCFHSEPASDRPDLTLDDISMFRAQVRSTSTTRHLFVTGSWFDSSTANTAIRAFQVNKDNSSLQVSIMIGAWDHEMRRNADPYMKHGKRTKPIPPNVCQQDIMLCFFDGVLKGKKAKDQQLIIYYTLGEGAWKKSPTWPPSGVSMEKWFFGAGGILCRAKPIDEEGIADKYVVDFLATTGTNNRWHTSMAKHVKYGDRRKESARLLHFTMDTPLESDLEITGHPVVTLFVKTDFEDGAFIVYLEDVGQDGKVTYITEGELRAVHRKLLPEVQAAVESCNHIPHTTLHSFLKCDAMPLVPGNVEKVTIAMHPISVQVRAGHRLRVAVAGADNGNFDTKKCFSPQEQDNYSFQVQRNAVHASHIDLPVFGIGK